MTLICSLCGAHGSQRDRENGRCGSCGSFYTGEEEVVESAEGDAIDPPITSTSGESPEPADSRDDALAAEPAPSPATDDNLSASADVTREGSDRSPAPEGAPDYGPSAEEGDDDDDAGTAVLTPDESEGLVKPRQLSPQFRRHIQMTWQPSLDQGGRNAESTLSSSTPSQSTKSDGSLSIGTRKVDTVDRTGKRKSGGDYELKEIIGEGSMGRVWSARQSSLDRDVAVKVPLAELASAGSLGEGRFISEVVVTGKLEHPNIVPIYELGRDTDGLPFYSMKHVQGRPWNEIIREKSEQENIEILMKVSDAIAFAHDRDFLHRDIKPHNVIVGEFGEVSVMDWGIAVSLTQDPDRSWAAVASGPAGTPAYMAPEMAAHNASELGVVSDVYLLGAVLYEIVTGTPPHPRAIDTGEALLAAAANEITPTEKRGELVDIARRAMATDPLDRYQSVPELQEALREYRSHRESIALVESARDHLTDAQETGKSDHYARARFAFEEAVNLWAGNVHAKEGLRTATLEYANNALQQGNYPLGLSILDEKEPSHATLIAQLRERQRASERREQQNKRLTYSVMLLITILAFGGVAAAYYMDQQRRLAVGKEIEARDLKVIAEREKRIAAAGEIRAQTARRRADQQRVIADVARVSAVESRDDAKAASRLAEEASYRSEISLAAESIRRNSFDKAAEIVGDLNVGLKSRLRHWEWAYLQHWLSKSAARKLPGLETGERVESVAMASFPDGEARWLVAAGTEGGLRLWEESQEGSSAVRLIAKVDGFRVSAVAISPDSRFVVTGVTRRTPQTASGESHSLEIYEMRDGELFEIGVLGNHSAPIQSVAFSGDGNRLLTSSADRKAKLWGFAERDRLADARPLHEYSDHSATVWDAQFSPDDQRVVTACEDGRVRVWTVDGSQLADFSGHQGPVYAAGFITNDLIASGGDDRRLMVWKPLASADAFREYRAESVTQSVNDQSGVVSPYQEKEIGRHDASIRCIHVAGEERYIFSGGHDNSLIVWSNPGTQPGSPQPLKVLRGHGRWVRDCAVSSDGTRLVSGAYDGAKSWDWQRYESPSVLAASFAEQIGTSSVESVPAEVSHAAYAPNGRWIASAMRNGDVAVWDITSPRQSVATRLGGGHRFLTSNATFFENGKGLLTSAGDNTTRLWDVEQGVPTQRFVGTGWRGVASVSQDGTVVLAGSDDNALSARVWRRQGGVWEELPLRHDVGDLAIDEPSETTAVYLSPSGRHGVVGKADGTCLVIGFDLEQGDVRVEQEFRAHSSGVSAVRLMDDDASLLTAGDDGLLRRWGRADGNLVNTLALGSAIRSVDVSPDGKFALVASSPRMNPNAKHPWTLAAAQRVELSTMKVQDQLLLEQIDSSAKLPPVVQSVAFAPDGDSALLTIFYPDRNKKQGLASWSWLKTDEAFRPWEAVQWGETTAALFRPSSALDGPAELLTLGGKGARLWEVAGATEVKPIPMASFRQPSSARFVAFSPDSLRLIAAGGDGTASIWVNNGDQWRPEAKLGGFHARELVAAMFDPRSPDRVLTASAAKRGTQGKIVIWQRTDGRWSPAHQLETQTQLRCVLFSPHEDESERFLFAGLEGGAARWRWSDIEAGRLQAEPILDRTVACAAFSADGTWLASSGDATAQLWATDRLGDGPLAQLTGHSGAIMSIAISQDKRRLITGSADFTAKLWDVDLYVVAQRGEVDVHEGDDILELLTLDQHDGEVTSVSFSPDGRNVLTTGQDGRAIIEMGEAVPPSIWTAEQVTFERNAAQGRIAEDASLQTPTQASFSRTRLVATIEGPPETGATGLHGELRVDDPQVNARWDVSGGGGLSNEFVFSPRGDCDRESCEQLLRSLVYVQMENETPLTDKTATAENAMSVLRPTIGLSLNGVTYEEWDADSANHVDREYPAAEVEIELEIEIDPPEVVFSSSAEETAGKS